MTAFYYLKICKLLNPCLSGVYCNNSYDTATVMWIKTTLTSSKEKVHFLVRNKLLKDI